MIRSVFLVFCLLFSLTVFAFEEREFKTPQDESLYHELITELRCLVCQNQNIADSNADLAVDLRREIYNMIETGSTRRDIVDFMVQRYGEFVLYKPRFSMRTLVLWLAPALLLLAGFLVLWRSSRAAATAPVASPDAKALLRAQSILDEAQDEDK